jgi:hypothetical protein
MLELEHIIKINRRQHSNNFMYFGDTIWINVVTSNIKLK